MCFVLDKGKLFLSYIAATTLHIFVVQVRYADNDEMLQIVDLQSAHAEKSLDLDHERFGKLIQLQFSSTERILLRFLLDDEAYVFCAAVNFAGQHMDVIPLAQTRNSYLRESFVVTTSEHAKCMKDLSTHRVVYPEVRVDACQFEMAQRYFAGCGLDQGLLRATSKAYWQVHESAAAFQRPSLCWNRERKLRALSVSQALHKSVQSDDHVREEELLYRRNELEQANGQVQLAGAFVLDQKSISELARMQPEDAAKKYAYLAGNDRADMLTEQISSLCDLYADFKSTCAHIVARAMHLFPLSEDDQLACGADFLKLDVQQMLDFLKARTDEMTLPEANVATREARVPVFEFSARNIHFRIAVDPRAHSLPMATRGSFQDTKRDLWEAQRFNLDIEVAAAFENSHNNALVRPPLACLVDYFGFQVLCEAQDQECYTTLSQQPMNSQQKAASLPISGIMTERKLVQGNLVFGYDAGSADMLYFNTPPAELRTAIIETQRFLNIGRHFIPMPKGELNSNGLDGDNNGIIDPFLAAFFTRWLEQRSLNSGKQCTARFLNENRPEISDQLPWLRLANCGNQVFDVKTGILDQRLAFGVRIIQDPNKQFSLQDGWCILIPDLPSVFSKSVLCKVNELGDRIGIHAQDFCSDTEGHRLPLQYTQMIAWKTNSDYWMQRLYVDSKQMACIEADFEAYLQQVAQNVQKLDVQRVNRYLVAQMVGFQAEYAEYQIQHYSDMYRTHYLPCLQQLLDEEITKGVICAWDVDDVFDCFSVPSYLRLYTAFHSKFDELQSYMLLQIAVKSLVLLLRRAIRSLLRQFQQSGYRPELENHVINVLELKTGGQDPQAEGNFDQYKNTGKKIAMMQRLVRRQVVLLLNAFLGSRPQEKLFARLSSTANKHFYQHAFAEHYCHIQGRKAPASLKIMQDGVLRSDKNKSFCLAYFQSYTNCVMLDKAYDFAQECPFGLDDVVDILPVVTMPAPRILQICNTPYRRWNQAVRRLEAGLIAIVGERLGGQPEAQFEFFFSKKNNDTENILLLKSLLYNLRFSGLSYNCDYLHLLASISSVAGKAAYCYFAIFFAQRNHYSFYHLCQQASWLDDAILLGWAGKGGFANRFQAADLANQLVCRYFGGKSMAHVVFTAQQCQLFNASASSVDSGFFRLVEDLFGGSTLAAELYNQEGCILYRSGAQKQAEEYFSQAVQTLSQIVEDQQQFADAQKQQAQKLKQRVSELTGGAIQAVHRKQLRLHDNHEQHEVLSLQPTGGQLTFANQTEQAVFWQESDIYGHQVINPLAELGLALSPRNDSNDSIAALQNSCIPLINSKIVQQAAANATEMMQEKVATSFARLQCLQLLLSYFLTNLAVCRQSLNKEAKQLVFQAIKCRSFLGRAHPRVLELLSLLGSEQFASKEYLEAAQSYGLSLTEENKQIYPFCVFRQNIEENFRMLIKSCMRLAEKRNRAVIASAGAADIVLPSEVGERLKRRIMTSNIKVQDIVDIVEKCRETQSKLDWWECIWLVRIQQ